MIDFPLVAPRSRQIMQEQITRQVQETTTVQQSLTVVKNVLRTGLACICFTRHIFDDRNFKTHSALGPLFLLSRS